MIPRKKGNRNNTKNWGIFLGLNSKSLCLLQRQKEKEAGIPFSISPNKQRADEKWEHKQAREPRMCSPRSENVPLESETIFSERESWLDTKWVSQKHWEQSTDGSERFSLSVFYHINFWAVFIFFRTATVQNIQTIGLLSGKTKKSSKPLNLENVLYQCHNSRRFFQWDDWLIN